MTAPTHRPNPSLRRRRRSDRALVGAGVAVCAACCAGPIAAFLAASGLGIGIGLLLAGGAGLLAAAAVVALALIGRRRRRQIVTPSCTPHDAKADRIGGSRTQAPVRVNVTSKSA